MSHSQSRGSKSSLGCGLRQTSVPIPALTLRCCVALRQDVASLSPIVCGLTQEESERKLNTSGCGKARLSKVLGEGWCALSWWVSSSLPPSAPASFPLRGEDSVPFGIFCQRKAWVYHQLVHVTCAAGPAACGNYKQPSPPLSETQDGACGHLRLGWPSVPRSGVLSSTAECPEVLGRGCHPKLMGWGLPGEWHTPGAGLACVYVGASGPAVGPWSPFGAHTRGLRLLKFCKGGSFLPPSFKS